MFCPQLSELVVSLTMSKLSKLIPVESDTSSFASLFPPMAPEWLKSAVLKTWFGGRLKRSARAVCAQCNYLGV